MTRLFPDARDYRTINIPISPEQLDRMEKRIGARILPGQRDQYQYFEMLDPAGNLIGHTIAVTQKGEFGAIEFVFGLDKEQKIIAIYIQRARERDRSFREDSFLNHFIGRSTADADLISDPLGEKGTIATRAVAAGVRKELTAFDELVRGK